MKIALLDDMDYWIAQIKNSIPNGVSYEFHYFDSYHKVIWKHFDIVFLDYFLDIDNVTWDKIIDFISSDIIVWFSSDEKWCKAIENSWAQYSCRKILSSFNSDLENLFFLIFAENYDKIDKK